MGRLRCAVLILAAALAAPVWAAQSPIGLARAFGAAPQCTHVTLSPSGRMLAWQQPGKSGADIVIYDIDAHAVRRTVRVGSGLSVGWMGWEGDGTLLMSTHATKRMPPGWSLPWNQAVRWSRVLAVDIASGHSRILLTDREQSVSYVDTGVDLLAWDIPQRPNTVIMAATVFDEADYRAHTGTLIHSARTDSGLVSAVFSVDTSTGKDEPIAYGDPSTSQWVVDEGGNLLARSEWRSHRYTVEARQGSRWRQIYQRTARVEPNIEGLDAKAHALLVTMRDGHRWHLWTIPLDGSAPKRMLPAVQQQVVSVDFSRYADRPTAVWVGRSDTHRIWIGAAAKLRYESVAHAFPGREVKVYDPTRDGTEVLAKAQAADEPPIYYLVNFASHRADIAGEAYPQLAHIPLGTVHTVQYQTRNGRTVRAQVTLPPGGSRDLPLVVLAPGGPEGDDPGKFDWLAQYLAASGYAVLQPDITLTWLGTQGGPLAWGGASQRYALDGVHLLVQQGVVDPQRVCIVGVGYGGYAALSGVAFSPGAYACAVSVNGISDLSSLLGHEMSLSGGAHSIDTVLTSWRTHVGSPFDPKVIAESPVHAAKAVVAPVLLIHDEEDTIVPLTQSVEMSRALQNAGKRVTFVKLAGSDHWLNRGRTRTEVLTAIGGFLHTYLH